MLKGFIGLLGRLVRRGGGWVFGNIDIWLRNVYYKKSCILFISFFRKMGVIYLGRLFLNEFFRVWMIEFRFLFLV